MKIHQQVKYLVKNLKFFIMALIPITSIDDIWDDLFKNQPKINNIPKFLDYFVTNYFEGRFPVKLWNHFDTKGPRTNNNLESYNSKLKKCVGIAHPNIFKVIKHFKQEEVLAT